MLKPIHHQHLFLELSSSFSSSFSSQPTLDLRLSHILLVELKFSSVKFILVVKFVIQDKLMHVKQVLTNYFNQFKFLPSHLNHQGRPNCCFASFIIEVILIITGLTYIIIFMQFLFPYINFRPPTIYQLKSLSLFQTNVRILYVHDHLCPNSFILDLSGLHLNLVFFVYLTLISHCPSARIASF